MNELTGTLLAVPEIPKPPLSSLDSFLAASPGQQHQAWFDYIAQEEEITKPLSVKLQCLRDNLEKAKPRSPEKASIKNEITEIENQRQRIKAEFEGRWYEAAIKLREELGEYVKARYRGSEEAVSDVLDEFYEIVGQGGYFENCPDRWFKHPSREVLEDILKDAVNKGDLKPITLRPVILPEAIATPTQLTLF